MNTFNNFNENERNRQDESTVVNDQDNETDNISIKKLRSFSVNINPLLDEEISIKKHSSKRRVSRSGGGG